MSKPQLCVTVTAATTAELRRARDAAADADLVELRLDAVSDPDVAGALAGRRAPVIVTCRPAWEGGGFTGSEEERKRLLSEAVSLGAEYVDLEWRAHFDDLIAARGGRGIVLSMHDFGGVPSDLRARLAAMRSTGAQMIKLAVQMERLSDCVPLLELGVQAGSHGGLVIVGMGEYGLATRVLAGRFESAWTYAGSMRGLGQPAASTLLTEYNFRRLGPATELFGVVGGNVSHSVSPAMHNAAFRALRRDAVYLPLPAVDAADFVTFGKALGLSGASVTIPHKIGLFQALDEVYPVARRIGAINTIRVERGRWIGDNTDASGFLKPLRDRIAVDGLRISILGAGGAARAIGAALAAGGCSLRLHARNRAQAEQVAMLTSSAVGPWPPDAGSWDLLVNCTPIGQYPNVHDTPVPIDRLTGRYVYDLVYNPAATRLLRDAAQMGCQTIGGLEMLVAQAREQFQWWTGSSAPEDVMRTAAVKRLAEFVRDEDHVV